MVALLLAVQGKHPLLGKIAGMLSIGQKYSLNLFRVLRLQCCNRVIIARIYRDGLLC